MFSLLCGCWPIFYSAFIFKAENEFFMDANYDPDHEHVHLRPVVFKGPEIYANLSVVPVDIMKNHDFYFGLPSAESLE